MEDKFNNPAEIIDLVKSLNLIKGEYAICGGAMMVIRGIKPATHDIDVLVTDYEFQRQLTAGNRWEQSGPPLASQSNCLRWNGIELLNVRGFIKVPRIREYIIDAECLMISFMQPLVKVSDTIEWKQIANRPQDIKDIELIREWYSK